MSVNLVNHAKYQIHELDYLWSTVYKINDRKTATNERKEILQLPISHYFPKNQTKRFILMRNFALIRARSLNTISQN